MEVVDNEGDLCGVEHGRRDVEAPRIAQVREQFAAADVLEQHVQAPVVVFRAQPITPQQHITHDRLH